MDGFFSDPLAPPKGASHTPQVNVTIENSSDSRTGGLEERSHYTISTDQIAAGDKFKFYALKKRGDAPESTSFSPAMIPPPQPPPGYIAPRPTPPGFMSFDPEGYYPGNVGIVQDTNPDRTVRVDSSSAQMPTGRKRIVSGNGAKGNSINPLKSVESISDSFAKSSFHRLLPTSPLGEASGVEMARDAVNCEENPESYSQYDSLISRQSDLIKEMQMRIEELEADNPATPQVQHRQSIQTSQRRDVQVFHQIIKKPETGDIENMSSSSISEDDPPGYQIFLSEPSWYIWGSNVRLKATGLVTDPEGYLYRSGRVNFAIYKVYDEEDQVNMAMAYMKSNQPLPEPEPMRQDVLLASDKMKEAVASVFKHPTVQAEYGDLSVNGRIEGPFTWWFHFRNSHVVDELQPTTQEVLRELTCWIETTYGSLYNRVMRQFSQGKVSRRSVPFFYRPGELVVSSDNDMLQAHMVTARAKFHGEHGSIETRSLAYAGAFHKDRKSIDIRIDTKSEDQEIEISGLDAIPMSHVSNEVRETLCRRGKMFWKCRDKRFVSYDGRPSGKRHMGNRFMSDFATYKELHPNNPYASMKFGAKENLDWDAEEPPSPAVYMFPPRLPAFDLRRKKWEEINVDNIRDVEWNENAFKSLVADDDMKELILALVTNQLACEMSTDVIENKGNGLIMLLHGSPGTGKTFTAESVAEVARKPLYSVTCGDIGTEPEKVEKYLESVFHLAKIWDCVVLLDEAEVFLEQRTLQDLSRNALVSVFLRALEYFDEILILTTNRVGTFDEAFKSRIQLALRYERLTHPQRKQIWRNFLERLKTLESEYHQDEIYFADIEAHLDDLAGYEMNGRQIRNSITTARQLAKYKKDRLSFAYLKRTIGVADKFDKYLSQVREGDIEEFEGKGGGGGVDGKYSDDYIARSDQTR